MAVKKKPGGGREAEIIRLKAEVDGWDVVPTPSGCEPSSWISQELAGGLLLRRTRRERDGRAPGAKTYFVVNPATGHIKIGFTRGNPRKRLHGLRVGNHDRLQLLGWIWGDREYELHDVFSRHHASNGEWFSGAIKGDVLDLIGTDPDPAPEVLRARQAIAGRRA